MDMSTNTNAPVLQVRGLGVSYGKSSALENADLEIAPGCISTVIGPNGAGKSSMLNAIAGALPAGGRMTGQILLDGQDISAMPVEQRVAAGISLVPERRELFSSMSVEDNLLLGSYARYRRGERGYLSQMEVVYALFPRLQERRRQPAGTMSGGERQMLALGRALMTRPRVLLLDEPSLGLAPLIIKEILRIVAGLRHHGVAILLVEQNARAALQTADTACVLETGRIVMQGTAAALAGDQRIADTYLGVGATAAPASAAAIEQMK